MINCQPQEDKQVKVLEKFFHATRHAPQASKERCLLVVCFDNLDTD